MGDFEKLLKNSFPFASNSKIKSHQLIKSVFDARILAMIGTISEGAPKNKTPTISQRDLCAMLGGQASNCSYAFKKFCDAGCMKKTLDENGRIAFEIKRPSFFPQELIDYANEMLITERREDEINEEEKR